MTESLTLYHYWRSSSSWRVRWALAVKNIPCEFVAVNLLDKEQSEQSYLKKNPAGQVPCLQAGENVFCDSVAIMEWLEEAYPTPAILPSSPEERVHVRALTHIVASGTQPLQNLVALQYHSDQPAERKTYAQFWIKRGLKAYESSLEKLGSTGSFSYGETLTMADLCLIPQCYNARRFDIDLKDYPRIAKIEAHCLQLESCQLSHPDVYDPARS